jgi:CRP-like cAMP-binding protein
MVARLRAGKVAGLIQHFCSPWISAKNAVWEKVLHLGQKHSYNKGNIIFGGSQPAVERLYYLYSGTVKFYGASPDGNEKIIWYLEKGNIFGEVPFFEGKVTENVFVATEKCVVYTFSRQCFNAEILPKHPDLVTNLLYSMANKIRVVTLHASDLAALPSRVCKVLIYLVDRGNGGGPAGRVVSTRGITQQELACILGVHRVTLNNVLAQLKQNGILDHMSKSSLVIKDYGRLLELAGK